MSNPRWVFPGHNFFAIVVMVTVSIHDVFVMRARVLYYFYLSVLQVKKYDVGLAYSVSSM